MSQAERFLQTLEQNGLDTTLLDMAEKSDFIASIVALQLQDVFETLLRMVRSEKEQRPEASFEEIISSFRKNDLNVRIGFMLAKEEQQKMRHRLALDEMMT